MFEALGITPQGLFAQLLVGLINGSFYAILSLGLAIIFGLLNIINFTHGAQYMLGAFLAWIGLTQLGQWLGFPELSINYWFALILVPLALAGFGLILERTMLRRLYHLDHLYGLLLTFGLALIMEGVFREFYGSSGLPYDLPDVFKGALDLGFMISFSGIVTFRNAEELREVARMVPLDSCLIETDSPHLAPTPYRGKVNNPSYVPWVSQQIAEIKHLSVEEVAVATTANTELLFRMPKKIS